MQAASKASGNHGSGGLSLVAVRGVGAVTPHGVGVGALWQGISSGKTAVRKSKQSRFAELAHVPVGSVPESVRSLPPFAGLSLGRGRACFLAGLSLREALESARLSIRDLREQNACLFLSTAKGPIDVFQRYCVNSGVPVVEEQPSTASELAAVVAEALDIRGTVQVVSAACASGTLAVGSASEEVRSGRSGLAVVLGVEILSEFVLSGFLALKGLSLSPARPFDSDRQGLNPAEASAVVILEPTQDLDRVRISGWGLSNDAHHITGPDPTGRGLCRAVREALNQAETTPDRVGAVLAHGTATVQNDDMEMSALERTFAGRIPMLCGIKGSIGHTFGAAGVIETVAATLMLDRGIVPRTVGHFRCARPGFNLLGGPLSRPSVLLCNSGFGGVNAAAFLESHGA